MTTLKQAYIGSNKTNQVILGRKNGTQLMRMQKDDDVKSNYTQVRTKSKSVILDKVAHNSYACTNYDDVEQNS